MGVSHGDFDNDEIAALDLIKREQGHTGTTAMWSSWGGSFSDAFEPVGTVTIDFSQLVKGYKMPSRLSRLKGKSKLVSGVPLYKTKSSGLGFYPVGGSIEQARANAASQLAESQAERVKAVSDALPEKSSHMPDYIRVLYK